MKSAVLTPKARNDLAESTRWIAKDNPAAARALRVAVQKMAKILGEHPHSGRERSDIAPPPVRFMALPGYPHIIIYDAALNPPMILRVMHGARDLPELLENL
jgi:toxin ParE1/3/4